MSYVPHIISNNGTVTVFTGDENLVFPPDHGKMAEVKQSLAKGDVETLRELAKPAVKVQEWLGQSGLQIKDGVIYYDGEPQHSALTDKILQIQAEGLPVDPLLKFMENLMQNPSKRAVDELWNFLSAKGLPITEDGCFLAFKRVREDGFDIHTGCTIKYEVGKGVVIRRNTVDENWRLACSSGIHVGSLSYVRDFGKDHPTIFIVKVNPADVVSVPESDCEKCRVCKLTVMGKYNGELPSDTYAKHTDYTDDQDWVEDEDKEDKEGEEDEENEEDEGI